MSRLASVVMGMLQSGPVEFASAAVTAGAGASPATVTKPSGLEVGDLVFVYLGYIDDATGITVTTTSGATWSSSLAQTPVTGDDVKTMLFWRFMTQTDISNAWTVTRTGINAVAVRYRAQGANAVSVQSSVMDAGSSTLTLPGFSKSALTYGVISFELSGTTTPAIPAGFVERYSVLSGFRAYVADNVSTYVDGTSVVWTPVGGGSPFSGFLVEVTGE